MRFTPSIPLAVAAAVLTVLPAAWAADAAPTSPADLQKLIDDGDYKAAVAGSSRLLAAKGTSPDDKAVIYADRGEAELHMKVYQEAASAFDKAARATTDPAAAATDAATAVLVKRSRNGLYTTKQVADDKSKIAPVDVVAADSRKTALGYLFADEFAAAEPRLKAAATATSIQPLLTAAQLTGTLEQLERAATGSDEKTKPAAADIAAHAKDMLSTALTPLEKRVAEIGKAADKPQQGGYNNSRTARGGAAGGAGADGGAEPVERKVGLSPNNKSELQRIIATAQQVSQAAATLDQAMNPSAPKPAAPAVPTATPPATPPASADPPADAAAGGELAGVAADAQKLATKANDLLNTYSGGSGTAAGGRRGF